MNTVLRRHTVALALLAALVAGVAGCGRPGAPVAAAPTEPPPPTPVTTQVDGRTLSGHCRGEQQGRPAVLLASGLGAGMDEFAALEDELAIQTRACAYTRAGAEATGKTPRPLADLVSDLDAFAAATGAQAPFVLVGRSLGATIAFRYAQAHPDRVAGFVALDPVPPQKTYLKRIRPLETAARYAQERDFYRGENDEKVDLADTERQLAEALPPTLRYTVLFSSDCADDRCARVLPALALTTRELATRGAGGTFAAAPGTSRQVLTSTPGLVLRTVDELLAPR